MGSGNLGNQGDSSMDNADTPKKGERDEALFLKYYSKYHQRIFAYIFSQLPKRADAEDVFQQTSIILWEKFDEFDQDREFFSWACGISFYSVKNFKRVSGRNRLVFSDELMSVIADERVAAESKLQDYGDLLDDCIVRLKPKEKDLIQLVYRGDRTIKEVADLLGRAVQTVYNRLNLIRGKLAVCIDHKRSAAK